MLNQSIGIVLISFLNVVIGHLKDLGEVTLNLTALPDIFEARIAGGQHVDLENYPFNCQFFNRGGLCSAIVLTRKTALTAAHCFDMNKNIGEMKLWAAARYLFDRSAQQFDIWDFTIHEHYNETIMFSNDIAAILIHGSFVFGRYIRKAVLSDGDTWMRETETMFMATGWGETSYGGELSLHGLMETHLRYISVSRCKTYYEGWKFSPEMFCLYGDGERDTCQGDSGGGIVWKNDRRINVRSRLVPSVVVGIVSHGSGCGTAPGVYVNVNHYQDWIKATIKELHRRYCHFSSFGR